MFTRRRLAIAAVLAMSVLPFLRAADPAKPKLESFTGKVIPLGPYLEKLNARLDQDAASLWYGLVADDGKVYPLIKDSGSRMFFSDPQLLNRPMRLTGRLVGATNFLQVLQVHSLLKGQLHDVYYWCDICAIKRFEKKLCDCCGAPMEFRELPAMP
jgi:hypothetical protein